MNKVVFVRFDELLPCPYNRAVDAAKVAEIADAIRASGEIRPFVAVEVSTDAGRRWMVTDGHHRLEAVRALVSDEALATDVKVPCVVSGEAGVESAADAPRRALLNAGEPFSELGTLRPVYDRDAYSAAAARQAYEKIYALVYAPILRILRGESLANSKADILKMIRAGRLRYKDGLFTGRFSAAASKFLRGLGAIYSRALRGYSVPWTSLPRELQIAISDARALGAAAEGAALRHLDDISGKIPAIRLNVESETEAVIDDLEKQFAQSAVGKITITTKLTAEQRRRLAEEYINNTETYIQGWADQAVARLRKKVVEAAGEGMRAETLAKQIMAEAQTTKARAQFIARQEMSLTVSKFRQDRYEGEGIERYRWATSKDSRVRHDHQKLSGRIFFFSDPPVVDDATGRRANPGEDFNCRCVAVPVINKRQEANR